jgi:hypothetical protein
MSLLSSRRCDGRWLTHSDHSRRQKDLVVPATKSPARAFRLGVLRVMLVWLARAKGVRTRPWRRPRPREHDCWRGPLLGVFDGGSFRVPLVVALGRSGLPFLGLQSLGQLLRIS